MELPALQQDLNAVYGLELSEAATMDQLETLLAAKINTLINEDFSRLIQLLYRIDVSETKLKKLLRENNGSDADRLIARLILERQWQKIETRRKYSS
jgi:hypothetical protein